MLFCSQAFLLFFAAFFAVYWTLPRNSARVYWLLAGSGYFYAQWSAWLLLVICFSSTADYLLARGIEATTARGRRKLFAGLSVSANLALLGYFKYSNFFLHALERVLHKAGVPASMPVLQIVVPIGISFYTFEAISYIVDVYRRRIPAERNLAHFMVFILFFPHLVAGPIVRARDFLPQVGRRKHWDWFRLHVGMQFFLLGVVKKLVIADRLAPFADPVFASPSSYSSLTLWLGTLAYVMQLYCDFSGYSDMAIGAAHMLGFRLPANFRAPYLAANPADFWRRWHISLSSWLRDYLYIPFGGGRGSRLRTAGNLLFVMSLCGLWHGANWNFILFGAMQGAWLIGHRYVHDYCEQRHRIKDWLSTSVGTAARIALTFWCFWQTIIVFRSASITSFWHMYRLMWSAHAGFGLPGSVVNLWLGVALVALIHVLGRWDGWRYWPLRAPAPLQGLAYGLAMSLALMFAAESGHTFIYFQF